MFCRIWAVKTDPALRDELRGIGLAGDVTSEADLARVQTEIESALGPVDLLVNNAGISGKGVSERVVTSACLTLD